MKKYRIAFIPIYLLLALLLGLPKGRVFGTGTGLDPGRAGLR